MNKIILILYLVNGIDFKEGVEKLADLLNISKHPDHLITLEAIHKFILQRLNSEAIKNPSNVLPKVNIFIKHLIYFVTLTDVL